VIPAERDPLTREPTARLLWEACRRYPRPVAIRAAIAEGADMEVAAAAAVNHRIGPLLWRALSAAGAVDSLPGDASSTLRAVSEAFRMEALILLPRAVAAAVAPLIDAGLEPVVLKGPAVAARYPEPGLRPMEDIDLLLPRGQHESALRILEEARWQVIRPARNDLYDTVLTHPDVPSLFLELHYGLEASSQRVTALDPMGLWKLRKPIDCLGTPAFGLPLAEEIVMLAAHAGKPHHGFAHLIWIADLTMILGQAEESGHPVDWDRLRSIAASARCTTVVGAALSLARHAGLDGPTDLFTLPTRGWRGSALQQLLDVQWPLAHLELPGYHLNYALADSLRRRIQILLVLLGSGYGIGGRLRRTTGRLGGHTPPTPIESQ
jgi:hypothetical protein